MVVCGTEAKATNLACECVVDVKARDAADASPCGHGHYKKEKEPRVRSGKGEEGC